MAYEILLHSADIGIEARAAALPDVFADAARALAAVILDADPPASERAEDIAVDGADLEDTLVQFLAECLYRYETRGDLVVGAALDHVSPVRAQGQVFVVDEADAAGPTIKAVTYTGLVVTRFANGWMARCYLAV